MRIAKEDAFGWLLEDAGRLFMVPRPSPFPNMALTHKVQISEKLVVVLKSSDFVVEISDDKTSAKIVDRNTPEAKMIMLTMVHGLRR